LYELKKTMLRNLWKTSRRWLPGVIISLGAVILIIHSVDWESARSAWASLDWRYIPLFSLLYLSSTGSRAMANRTLLGGKPTFGQSFLAMMQGYLLNNILPFRLGELGRAFLLGRKTGLSTFHTLSAIVIERAYDMAFAAMLVIGTLPFVLGEQVPWARPVALTTLGVVAAGLLSLHLMARFRLPLHGWLDRTADHNPLLARHVLPGLDAFLDGLETLTSLPRFALSSFWMLMTWIFGAGNYYILLIGFVKIVPLWVSVFGLGVTSLGIALPSAPASLGVFEGAMVAALTIVGISSGTALAYAIALHLLHIIHSGIIGLYEFSREGESLISIYKRLLPNKK